MVFLAILYYLIITLYHAIWWDLVLSRAISSFVGYLGIYPANQDYLGYPWIYLAISGSIWLSLAISGYLWLFLAISGYLGLFRAILGYLLLTPAI